MRPRRSSPLRQRTLLCLVLAFGCASDPANTLAPGHEGAPGVKRFLVCAPNTVIALPAELQDATGALREQIDAYLHFHDREVQWLDLYDSKRLWTEAMTAAKAKGVLEKTPEFFAKQLDEQFDFDAIVMPSLLVHQARATNGYASWYGVERRMRVGVEKGSDRAFRRDDLALAQQLAHSGASGDFMVTSVHVLIYARDGERVFEGRGGIEFVQLLDLSAFVKKRIFAFRVRDDLPGPADALREGIAVAFDPYLAPPVE